MNKNGLYFAIFSVLCVLVGIVVGAGISRIAPFSCQEIRNKHPEFMRRTERFMWKGHGDDAGMLKYGDIDRHARHDRVGEKSDMMASGPGNMDVMKGNMSDRRMFNDKNPEEFKEKLFDMFVTELSLTDEQQVKVKDILDNTRREIDKIGENVRESIMEIKEKADNEIMSRLTSDQQSKFKELLDKMEKKRREMEKNGGFGMMDGRPGPGFGPM
ncbi:MAG: hypothetical protein PHP69_02845 [Candidatus Omnitrophica bacterium]|nr:hypothetical protein [Candidatus Omnitrophota bacterium]MDD5081104.1 hypothetical protein [Candidatus Omnitrophota bacterium]MDD5441762.1 hypothetical protein [Candidatus Omnitrophota bacterium]